MNESIKKRAFEATDAIMTSNDYVNSHLTKYVFTDCKDWIPELFNRCVANQQGIIDQLRQAFIYEALVQISKGNPPSRMKSTNSRTKVQDWYKSALFRLRYIRHASRMWRGTDEDVEEEVETERIPMPILRIGMTLEKIEVYFQVLSQLDALNRYEQ